MLLEPWCEEDFLSITQNMEDMKTGKSKYVKINSLWWDHQEGQKKKNGENIGIPILYIE